MHGPYGKATRQRPATKAASRCRQSFARAPVTASAPKAQRYPSLEHPPQRGVWQKCVQDDDFAPLDAGGITACSRWLSEVRATPPGNNLTKNQHPGRGARAAARKTSPADPFKGGGVSVAPYTVGCCAAPLGRIVVFVWCNPGLRTRRPGRRGLPWAVLLRAVGPYSVGLKRRGRRLSGDCPRLGWHRGVAP